MTSACIALAGCSMEKALNEKPPVQTEFATLDLPMTRADAYATTDELRINSARLVIFRSAGQAGAGQFILNKRKTTTIELATPFHEIIPVGKIDIYLIANEKATWDLGPNSDPVNIAGLTPAIIEARQLTYTAYPVVNSSNPVPMFGVYKNVDIHADGSLTQDGTPLNLVNGPDVDRCIAKLIVKMDFTDPNGNPMTFGNPSYPTGMYVRNMPKISYLYPKTYTEWNTTDFFDGAGVTPVIDASENLTIGKVNRTYTTYLPEYLPDMPSLRTWLVLLAAGKTFNIALGDGIEYRTKDWMAGNDATLTDLRISRNTCYIITITGILNNLIVFDVSVEPWDPISIDLQ
jgi:hypothetical protein